MKIVDGVYVANEGGNESPELVVEEVVLVSTGTAIRVAFAFHSMTGRGSDPCKMPSQLNYSLIENLASGAHDDASVRCLVTQGTCVEFSMEFH